MIKGLHHIGFQVDDLEEAVLYYKSLGFNEINRFEYEEVEFQGVMMKAAEYGNIEFFKFNNPNHEMVGKIKSHSAFETDDIETDIQSFLDRGYELAIPIASGKIVKKRGYVKDAYGNFIELLEL
ncbi:hypothetical protein A3F37_00945 [Candidatus Saccharibacteria bacterium RIFCSPHIGHO2_12_FULL_41_12]|nr:MAG: hypothetical protein A3F37_00945 [Candidatus Saccharibacteria bacterium RIFCSPHIGHO2_12_FULL_41_12]